MEAFNQFYEKELEYIDSYNEFVKGTTASSWYPLEDQDLSSMWQESLNTTSCPKKAGFKLAADLVQCRKRAYNMRSKKRSDFFAYGVIHATSKRDQLEDYKLLVEEFTSET